MRGSIETPAQLRQQAAYDALQNEESFIVSDLRAYVSACRSASARVDTLALLGGE